MIPFELLCMYKQITITILSTLINCISQVQSTKKKKINIIKVYHNFISTINISIFHLLFSFSNLSSSPCFFTLPDVIGSLFIRFRLKKPHLYNIIMRRISKRRPATAAPPITHQFKPLSAITFSG